MPRNTLLRAAAILMLVPVSGWAIDGWTQLRPGMTRNETAAVLGTELVSSRGRGFEVAIYDGRAEVVFLHGHVVAWTAPTSSEAPPAPATAWQFNQAPRVRAAAQSSNRAPESRSGNIRRASILPAYRL